jgi:cyclic beta-1,2-glucan synthetase
MRPQGDAPEILEETVEQLAHRLARAQTVARAAGGSRRFRRRLRELERSLAAVHRSFRSSPELREACPRTAEWLLDNSYLTRGALRQVNEILGPGFLRELPRLGGRGDGRDADPRIRVLAAAVLEHGRAELDIEELTRFVRAYQDEADISIGELWALPAMLQLSLLERLDAATSGLGGAPWSAAAEPAAEPGAEVAACIESLRLVAGQDWRRFVEEVSRVEEILRLDPASAYGRMEIDSRDRYRQAVEEIARGIDGPESAGALEARVATTAIERGTPPAAGGADDGPESHVGHHLVGERREAFERQLASLPPWRVRGRRWILRHAAPLYFGFVAIIALLASLGLGILGHVLDMDVGARLVVIAAGVVPAVTVAVSLANWLATHLVPPRILPKLEVGNRLPDELSTVVALPVLVANGAELEALLAHLEVLRHASPLEGLMFVLLTDFADAPRREMPGDAELLDAARRGIRRLNERDRGDGTFCLLHRPRRWNPSEGCWMGWERKRGKLEQLNLFLLGADGAAFSVQEGEVSRLRGARFVVTLDADTMLPPGAVGRLIGTLAHPLNRPAAAPGASAGYGILQPRIDTFPPAGRSTPFLRLAAGEDGLDLYSHAASDVHQDLFGEGLYAGKGIYEVRAFHGALDGRVPENAILSHDLFEGLHGRVALVSDIRVLEDYPANAVAYLRRLHRWIRGDWQLLPWLGRRVPGPAGTRIESRFDGLDRWKILDNLRRSLLAPSLLALLLVGWLTAPRFAWLWPALVAGVYALPVFLGVAGAARRFVRQHGASRYSRHGIMRDLARNAASVVGRSSGRWLLALLLLPNEALVAVDAVGRTLVRLGLTRRHLLLWESAAHSTGVAREDAGRPSAWTELWHGPAVAIATLGLVLLLEPASLPAAAPLAAAWLASPGIAAFLGRPRRPRRSTLSRAGRRALRLLALRTWMYFERLVGSEDNWLPPDNFREGPEGRVARRTSPTNIGMMLGATQAAYDLGFVDVLLLEATLRNVLDSLRQLERHRGHLLNWYSTADLAALEPRYVSTVDSGNLAATLMAVGRGLEEASRRPPLSELEARGLRDSLAVLAIVAHRVGVQPGVRGLLRRLDGLLDAETARIREAEDVPGRLATVVADLADHRLGEVDDLLLAIIDASQERIDQRRIVELRDWSQKVRQHVAMLRRLARRLLPWLTLLEDPAASDAPGALVALLGHPPALRDFPAFTDRSRELLEAWERAGAAETSRAWRDALRAALAEADEEAGRVLSGLASARDEMRRMVDGMDFRFLFDAERELFHIGYDVTSESPDPHHYDLLASEARIASLLAIARGDVPVRHWLRLGRPFGRVGGSRVLLSWGATMFEYLLPPLFTRMPEESLLHHACRQAVRGQIRFGDRRGIPWGVSESGYHGSGADLDYPYRAFGIPELGLRRGLGERLVVAPYASLLALSIDPRAVERNLERLHEFGMLGRLGPYESLDFGAPRDETRGKPRIVRAYMAHHQGMILIAIDNHLNSDVMVERFHADPRIGAVEHLLHERIPWQVPARRAWTEAAAPPDHAERPSPVVDWEVDEGARHPASHLLSNGRYSILITARGAGGSTWDGVALTRWRADPTLERSGTWIYVCDPEAGETWSATREPTARRPESSSVRFAPHLAEFQRRDAGIFVRTRVIVAAHDDVEVRHLSIANESDRPRRLALASYAEVVLGSAAEDLRHPAYSKLFVESEILEPSRTLLFRRRPRAADERRVHLGQALVAAERKVTGFAWETDRAAFIGRGGDEARPEGLRAGRLRLTGRTGATLDPICSLGCEMRLAPYEHVELAFVTAAGSSRARVLTRLDRYRSLHRCEYAADWAREQASVLFDELDIPPARAPELQRLLSGLVHADPGLRGRVRILDGTGPSRSGLWKHGISGDLPILLVRTSTPDSTSLLERTLRGYAYLRRLGAQFDLVVVDRGSSGYAQPLRDRLHALLEETGTAGWLGRRGGIHVVGLPGAGGPELELLETIAHVTLDEGDASLAQQLDTRRRVPAELPAFVPVPSAPISIQPVPPLPAPEDLTLFNGFGGFSRDGREYVIRLEPGDPTPAPWANVIANPGFGFVVTERGGGYTWALNAGENRITPWRNDPVIDRPGEVLYLRDEETGHVWTVTPAPAGPAEGPEAACEVRHGAGHTTFRRRSHGLEQELTMWCAPEDPVKLVRLRATDLWGRQRRITATCYLEWVLGSTRQASAPHVITDYDAEAEVLLARNPFDDGFGSRVSFLGSSRPPHGVTTDRTEFLGRDGGLERPAGLYRIGLTGRVSGPADPCGAFQVHLDIVPGGEIEVHFLIGQAEDREAAVGLARRYRDADTAAAALEAVGREWDGLLGVLTVETPEPGLDVMLNRWLLYQTVASRLRARTGLYQSSGAFGFRDQLQDVLAPLHAAPALARAHILEAAARQFEEGDVLHWWQPGTSTGVRTRCSDDLLWLPYVTALYVQGTGDDPVLEEQVPFLRGEPLRDGEDERYASFETAPPASLYQHCLRAVDRGATRGEHGLPLIGTGDWNDGLDRVGIEGRGESVWLGWFLAAVLEGFAPVCESRGDHDRAREYRRRAAGLLRRIDEVAWDGAWFHRAYYDDGTPLGSAAGREARIDVISQAWSVLAGGRRERARRAMRSVSELLVLDEERLVLLLAPPFDRTQRDPGYIRGYPPGVRENGGQYTHAATWAGWAFAELGERAEAGRILGYLNPARRVVDREAALRYRVEPYVVAADVYGVPPHLGRGGWTWYTGSAAWLYRFATEAVLGLRREADRLHVEPRLPPEWEGYRARLRYGEATYRIEVRRVEAAAVAPAAVDLRLDGDPVGAGPVTLVDDGGEHRLEVRIS